MSLFEVKMMLGGVGESNILPIAAVMALHPGPAKVYFWHLGK